MPEVPRRARGFAGEKCLTCHGACSARIAAGRACTRAPSTGVCETCHVEHQGRDVDLVWWGKVGAAFDHRLTGYPLEGKHAPSPARPATRPVRRRQGRARRRRQNLGHTYLGLRPPACVSRRRAPWAVRGAAMPVLPRHAGLEARRPLRPREDGLSAHGPARAPWRARSATRPSPGRGGGSSASTRASPATARAATTTSTRAGSVRPAPAATRPRAGRPAGPASSTTTAPLYPLRGRHATVACETCHAPARPLRCASRVHRLPRRRSPRTARPPRRQGSMRRLPRRVGLRRRDFDPVEHKKTGYPLAGAHLAVACDACHRPVDADALRKVPGLVVTAGPAGKTPRSASPRPSARTAIGTPTSGRWTAGRGKGMRRLPQGRVVEAGLLRPRQDALSPRRRPRKPACAACHPRTDKGTPRERTRLAATPVLCSACHKDPHQGQLQRAASTACDGCHGVEIWRRTAFDHTVTPRSTRRRPPPPRLRGLPRPREGRRSSCSLQAPAEDLQGLPRPRRGGDGCAMTNGSCFRRPSSWPSFPS